MFSNMKNATDLYLRGYVKYLCLFVLFYSLPITDFHIRYKTLFNKNKHC